MILAGADLLQAIEEGRLVISPASPNLSDVGIAIDLTPHDVFWRSKLPAGLRDVDVVVGLDVDPYDFMEPTTLSEIVLKPREFVLAETAEALTIPLDLCGWLEGKSGRARLGIEVHLTAPKIDPGWGVPEPKRITLEIVNNNHVPLRLRAGAPIAQIVFHQLSTTMNRPYSGRHRDKGS